jgi:hypothetical protein
MLSSSADILYLIQLEIEELVQAANCSFLQSRKDMAVRIQSDRNAAVTQPLLDDLRMDAANQHQRGMRMPQVVEPKAPKSSPAQDSSEHAPYSTRIQRVAVRPTKHKIAISQRLS